MGLTDEHVTTMILILVAAAYVVSLAIPQWTCSDLLGNQNLFECAKKDFKKGGGLQMTAFALFIAAALTATIGALRGLALMLRRVKDESRALTFLKWILLVCGSACGLVALIMFAAKAQNFSPLIATAATAVLIAQSIRVLIAETFA
ncbi:hypothetical protein Ciccas_011611 [Cichlidogyrus casuarinus]|uniref:Uncharacterized protein n=1 Tax=Cichlidogyrus casuarinus TaxID=1844966 RepID=A0ABD2PRM4_9PLAT